MLTSKAFWGEVYKHRMKKRRQHISLKKIIVYFNSRKSIKTAKLNILKWYYQGSISYKYSATILEQISYFPLRFIRISSFL